MARVRHGVDVVHVAPLAAEQRLVLEPGDGLPDPGRALSRDTHGRLSNKVGRRHVARRRECATAASRGESVPERVPPSEGDEQAGGERIAGSEGVVRRARLRRRALDVPFAHGDRAARAERHTGKPTAASEHVCRCLGRLARQPQCGRFVREHDRRLLRDRGQAGGVERDPGCGRPVQRRTNRRRRQVARDEDSVRLELRQMLCTEPRVGAPVGADLAVDDEHGAGRSLRIDGHLGADTAQRQLREQEPAGGVVADPSDGRRVGSELSRPGGCIQRGAARHGRDPGRMTLP